MNMKKIISLILAMALLLGSLPVQAAELDPPLLLQTATLEDEDTAEKYVYFATVSSQVAERGMYILTIRRSGETVPASVELKTVDISARYGEDYKIADSGCETEVTPMEHTLIEAGSLGDAQAQGEAEYAAIEELAEGGAESGVEDSTEGGVEDETDASSAEDPFSSLYGSMLRTLGLNMGEDIETSSTTLVEFAEGESEKQIVFEILEDTTAEGTESFDFMLANPSEELNLNSSVNCTITIEDDEPKEYSKVGFSSDTYTSSEGLATVKVVREGALYSVATVRVKTVDTGSAKEGIHFAPTDVSVQFLPYETEKDVPITSLSDESVSYAVQLSDIKGAEAAELVETTVSVASAPAIARNLLGVNQLKDSGDESDEKEFTIKPYDVEYTVRYKEGDLVGTIYDTRTTIEVAVGDYYFPIPDRLGGTFKYGYIEGYAPNNWFSRYGDSPAKKNIEPTYAGELRYYSSTMWKKGKAYFLAESRGNTFMNTRPYQYMFAKWAGDKVYTDKNAGFRAVDTSMNKVLSWGIESNMSEFSGLGVNKAVNSDKIMLVEVNDGVETPTARDVNLEFYVEDKNDGTPSMWLDVYGVAAMYRRFKVALHQPDEMDFKTVTGTTEKKAPALAKLGEGHDIRYTNQDISIGLERPEQTTPILGDIEKYIITVKKTATKQESFEYTPTEHELKSGTITVDEDFIKLVDEKGGHVERNAEGFHTSIIVKPVLKYRDVQVRALPAIEGGSFESSDLSVGLHTFHVGDVLNVAGTPDELYSYAGYWQAGYRNASDTAATVHNLTVYNNQGLFLEFERYELTPEFTMETNRIEVKLTNDALEKLSVSGILAYDKLPASLKGKRIIAVEPEVGKIYKIEAMAKVDAPDGKMYRPIFTYKGETYYGNVFDMVAEAGFRNNVVEIGVEEINPADYKYFQIDGTVTLGGRPIRDSAAGHTNYPATSATVIAGSKKSTVYDTRTKKELTVFDRVSSISDDTGAFSLKGIYALPGDRITVQVIGGEVERVAEIRLSDKGTAQQISFVENVYNPQTHATVPTDMTKQGYLQSVGNIELPQRTAYSPYVYDVTFKFDKQSSYNIADTRDNSIPIQDDYINITATAVLNGRKVKSAVFVVRSKNGDSKEYKVNPTSAAPNKFTASIKMDVDLASGDMVFVKLIDDKTREVTFSRFDEKAGNSELVKQQVDIVYAEVFTGLSFYVPTVEAIPQYFTIPESTKVEIPILGEMSGAMDSGILKFERVKYGDDQFAPYDEQVNLNIDFKYPLGSAKSIMKKVKNGYTDEMASIQDQRNQDPEKSIEDTGKQIANLFGSEEDQAMQKDVEKATKKAMHNAALSKTLAKISKPINIKTNVAVLLNFSYAYDYVQNEYVFSGGQYLCAAMADVSKNFYWLIYGVPVYVNVSGSFSLRFDGKFKTDAENVVTKTMVDSVENLYDVMTPENDMQMVFGAKVMAGVGICGVLGVRGIVGMDFLFRFSLDKERENPDTPLDGFRYRLYGGMAIDLVAFSIEYTPDWGVVGTGIYKDPKRSMGEAQATSVISTYDEGTADMSEFGKAVQPIQPRAALEPDVASLEVLLENAPQKTQPIIKADPYGSYYAFFVGRRKDVNGLNARCVMYSINDGSGWSTPVPFTDTAIDFISANGNKNSKELVKDYVKNTAEFNLSVTTRQHNSQYFTFIISFSKADEAIGNDGVVDTEVIDEVKAALNTFKIVEAELTVFKEDDKPSTISWYNYVMFGKEDRCNINANVGNRDGFIAYATTYTSLDLTNVTEKDELMDFYGKVGVEFIADYALDSAIYGYPAHVEDNRNPVLIEAPTEYEDVSDDAVVLDARGLSTKSYYVAKDNKETGVYMSFIAFSVDKDGNLNTTDDRSIYLQALTSTSGTYGTSRYMRIHYPFQISKAGESAELPRFFSVGKGVTTTGNEDGTDYLTWISDRSKLCSLNFTEALAEFYNKELKVAHKYLPDIRWIMDSPADDQPAGYEKKTAAELGLTAEQYEGTIYERLYNGELGVNEKLISRNTDQQRNISDMQLVPDGEDGFYFLWSEAGSNAADDTSVEVFGMAFKQQAGEDAEGKKSGWGEPVQLTDFGDVIGEFSAAPTSDGGLILMANKYTQTINTDDGVKVGGVTYSDHEIVSIEFNEVPSLEADPTSIQLSSAYPRAGAEETIYFTVTNTGMKAADGCNITVKVDVGGSVSVVDTVASSEAILSGDSLDFSVPWTVPSGSLENSKIIVEVEEVGVAGAAKVSEAAIQYGYDMEVLSSKVTLEDGKVYLNLDVTNNGNAPSPALTVKASKEAEQLGSKTTSAVAGGETLSVKLELNKGKTSVSADKNGTFVLDYEILAGATSLIKDSLTLHIPRPLAINLTGSKTQMNMGEKQKLTATFVPQNIEVPKVSYTSSDPTVATVDENGNVVANYAGVVTITAHNIATGLSQDFAITVWGATFAGDKTDDSGDAPDVEPPVVTPPAPPPATDEPATVTERETGEAVKNTPDGGTVEINVPEGSGSGDYAVEIGKEAVSEIKDRELELKLSTDELEFTVPPTAFDEAKPGDTAEVKATVVSRDPETALPVIVCDVTVSGNSVEDYGGYGRLVIPLPEGFEILDATTAVVTDEEGSKHHLPTNFCMIDGVLCAVVGVNAGGEVSLVKVESGLTDIKGQWYEKDAIEAAERKILFGYEDNTFRGKKSTTRAEFASILTRGLGLYISGSSSFDDVKDNDWFYDSVAAAVEKGLVTGRSETRFAPSDKIKRCEAMIMMHRAAVLLGYSPEPVEFDPSAYHDMEDVPDWAEESVIFCIENGIIKGSDDGYISPNKELTRAETSTLVLRFLRNLELINTRE